jgi:hypothetical protein
MAVNAWCWGLLECTNYGLAPPTSALRVSVRVISSLASGIIPFLEAQEGHYRSQTGLCSGCSPETFPINGYAARQRRLDNIDSPFNLVLNRDSPFILVLNRDSPFNLVLNRNSTFNLVLNRDSPFNLMLNRNSTFNLVLNRDSPFNLVLNRDSPLNLVLNT